MAGPHERLIPLLERHEVGWESFKSPGRPKLGVLEARRAIVRDLQVARYSWTEMVEITGMSNGFIQRNRDPDVSLRPETIPLFCAWCGEGFQDSPSNVRRKKAKGQTLFYCSKRCAGKGYSSSRVVPQVCAVCGELFMRKAGAVAAHERRGGKRVFCSTLCANRGLIKPYCIQDQALFDYLAGVVCGDGYVYLVGSGGGGGSRVSIAVGFQDAGYVAVLSELIEQVFGFPPTVQENRKARATYVSLSGVEAAELFAPIKDPDGWVLDSIRHPAEFIAGLCDADGWWPKKRGKDTRRSFSITQKDNGNLERTIPLWSEVGLCPIVHHYTSKSNGYKRAILRVSAEDIDHFKKVVPLRHPRKLVRQFRR